MKNLKKTLLGLIAVLLLGAALTWAADQPGTLADLWNLALTKSGKRVDQLRITYRYKTGTTQLQQIAAVPTDATTGQRAWAIKYAADSAGNLACMGVRAQIVLDATDITLMQLIP